MIKHKTIISSSPKQTMDFGKELSQFLKSGDNVLLKGELGSGKTTFTQGLAKGLGIKDLVRSSSFILVNEYNTPENLKFFHIDLYRLENNQIDQIGLDEYIYNDGICVIEWADKIKSLKLPSYWDISLAWVDENKRKIEIIRQKVRDKRVRE